MARQREATGPDGALRAGVRRARGPSRPALNRPELGPADAPRLGLPAEVDGRSAAIRSCRVVPDNLPTVLESPHVPLGDGPQDLPNLRGRHPLMDLAEALGGDVPLLTRTLERVGGFGTAGIVGEDIFEDLDGPVVFAALADVLPGNRNVLLSFDVQGRLDIWRELVVLREERWR